MRVLPRNRVLAFRRKIRRFYTRHRRDLPFRNTTDPYRITVSEIMLQQTQVSRGVPKYEAWIKKWPDWASLARASKKDLLAMWSGLGYNRRALYLGELARTVVSEYDGVLPEDPETLEQLPGIGPYTARAILIFAHNRNLVTIDTNIRRVILHEFNLSPTSARTEIESIARQVLPRGDARNWHYALMDYSSLQLPKRLKHLPPVTPQSRFVGSLRQIRGEIVRQLTSHAAVRLEAIAEAMERDLAEVTRAAEALVRDGVITLVNGTARLAE